MAGFLLAAKLFKILMLCACAVATEGAATLIFAGCDKNGWKCISSKVKTDKYDLEFDCNGTSSTSISLWNFRAPKEIFGLKISNCGYLEIDLSCGNDGQPIDSLYIYNIEHLNLTSPAHSELSYLPNKFVLDTIGRIERISTNLFKQTMEFPVQLFKCSIQGQPINTLFFTDIGQIDVIEHHAINLTEMSWFTWNNVTINEIEPMAMQVFMEKDKQFTIKQSQMSKIGYRGILLRAHSIFFNQTDIHEIEKYGISATVYWFDFTNSKIGTVYPKGFHLLAQNVNIMNNSFSQLEPKAFNGIGPGLLENALVSFGRLRFTYVFSRNRILQANVGSLNPDWEAYKNVKTFLNFTLNHLPCSCSELGWVNLDDGIGSGLADTVSFSTRIMEKKSQNMCVDAPCLLPLGVMSIMHFVNGTCQKASGLKEVCNKFINNKDFRTNILTESDKLTRNRANHLQVDLHQGNNVLDETLISDHPFPIVPVKSNLVEKKTEYLNYWEGNDDAHKRVKRGGNVSLVPTLSAASIAAESAPLSVPSNPKQTNKENRGAYKIDWKMVAKGSRHKGGVVYVPKIIEEPVDVVEYYSLTNSTSTVADASNDDSVPITIRPYGSGEQSVRSGSDGTRASIHEQISDIAEKLTKDIEQQVQERQMLEQEEEEREEGVSEELHEHEAPLPIRNPIKSDEEYKRRSGEVKKIVAGGGVRPYKKLQFMRFWSTAPPRVTTTVAPTEPEPDWDPLRLMDENSENSFYKELVHEKKKLETRYNNMTFPLPLVGKTKI